MARAALEYALAPAGLNALFVSVTERQYERKLLFSTLLDLTALVVCGEHPSVRSAYRTLRAEVPVSLTAVYDKLNGVEVATNEAIVAYSGDRLRPVVEAFGVERWVPGYRVRVLDGNHLAATERRLDVLRGCAAGPLPGQALVVLEPECGLVVQMVACEDGHAQERSLLEPIVAGAARNDLYIADRNFCTLGFLGALANRCACFVIRQHASMPVTSSGTLRSRGRTQTGAVYEQSVTLLAGEVEFQVRRIVIRLDTPTRDGDTEMAILTNLPTTVDAITVADLYRRRWTIETFFGRIEHNLQSELSSLGYPGAALFGFAVALIAGNVFAVVQAAMEAVKRTKPDVAAMPLSQFDIVEELRTVHRGMAIVLDDEVWAPFQTMPPIRLARRMLEWASHIDWHRYRKTVQGPRKPTPKRSRFKDTPHVSTARLLAAARGIRPNETP
jgi:Transposase DDE domain